MDGLIWGFAGSQGLDLAPYSKESNGEGDSYEDNNSVTKEIHPYAISRIGLHM